MPLTVNSLRFAIDAIQNRIAEIGEEMNTLDGQLGDGDLGITLINGYTGIGDIAEDLPDDLGTSLFQCAQAMTKVSASSYGTLTATAMMAAGKELKGKTEIEWSQISPLVRVALDAMMSRGGANLGDKTVLDPLDAVSAATEGIAQPADLVKAAGTAIEETLDRFRDQPCKVGKARIFAEKSIGMNDPGMIALQRLFGCIQVAVAEDKRTRTDGVRDH